MGATKILTISLPPKMSKEIQQLAKKEQRTISELIREAFRQYKMSSILQEGRREGKKLRKGKKLTDDDIERLVDALRK
jgi:predicted transcriptional regulator